jgi:Tfp pilus assembly protein PilF
MDLGHPAKALEYFEAALARAPSYYDAVFGLAMAREKLGDEAQARNLWLRYVREAPDSPWKEVARRHLGESAPSPR